MKISIISFSTKGFALAERLASKLNEGVMQAQAYRCTDGMLSGWTKEHFATADALVFVGATGIAVRAVAPYLENKTNDPAVLVIDETAKFVIPLLSGHIGGANRLANHAAEVLGAVPVITTATDCNNVFAVDTWASENNIKIINPKQIKKVSASLLKGGTIRFKSFFPIKGCLPSGLVMSENECDVILSINKGVTDSLADKALCLVPPVLSLGIGCKKGISAEVIETVFTNLLAKEGLCREAVYSVCSIDIKAKEQGILAFCEAHGLLFQTFSAAELAAVSGNFALSKFVLETTGVDNVCERSAVLGSGGKLIIKKYTENGVAMALAIAPYTVKFGEEV
ncbi:MAG: cobalt-precorrin 5A hydrolase [Clostridia bacterium]|nr:cobalt-precorrin 5A hydrolase [Clostridia bacterium]